MIHSIVNWKPLYFLYNSLAPQNRTVEPEPTFQALVCFDSTIWKVLDPAIQNWLNSCSGPQIRLHSPGLQLPIQLVFADTVRYQQIEVTAIRTLFIFVYPWFLYSFRECHELSAAPIPACLRRGPRGCFRSECYTGSESVAAPRVSCLLAPTHQRRAPGWTRHKYFFSTRRFW